MMGKSSYRFDKSGAYNMPRRNWAASPFIKDADRIWYEITEQKIILVHEIRGESDNHAKYVKKYPKVAIYDDVKELSEIVELVKKWEAKYKRRFV